MPTPGEHKTVQARILEYAEVIDWTIVSHEEAEQRCKLGKFFDKEGTPQPKLFRTLLHGLMITCVHQLRIYE